MTQQERERERRNVLPALVRSHNSIRSDQRPVPIHRVGQSGQEGVDRGALKRHYITCSMSCTARTNQGPTKDREANSETNNKKILKEIVHLHTCKRCKGGKKRTMGPNILLPQIAAHRGCCCRCLALKGRTMVTGGTVQKS